MSDTLKTVLDGLMSRYQNRVPDVEVVLSGMVKNGMISSYDDIQNDHIAFRTMGVPNLGIQSFEKIFLHLGYEKRDPYRFEKKKLDAFWYAPPDDKYPRIFISELCVDELSDKTSALIKSYTDEVKSDPVDSLDLDNGEEIDTFLHSALWRTPTWSDYEALREESEYAAWVIYNRYYLNHFTISVHTLPSPYNELGEFNTFLESLGVKLNDAGGKMKVSRDGLLCQSSTVAESISVEFPLSGGGTEEYEIPGSYVEFAERKVLPEFANLKDGELKREHRREGFESQNADKIFESTYRSQTDKESDS